MPEGEVPAGGKRNIEVTSSVDNYRAATILVREYGVDQGSLMAARRAHEIFKLRDVAGLRRWNAVLRAVLELTRTERRPDERVN